MISLSTARLHLRLSKTPLRLQVFDQDHQLLNFTPHAGPSGQRFPGVWPSGDGGGGWNMFLGEMNLGMSGHTYTSHDFADRSSAGIHWSLLGPWCPGALSAIPQDEMCRRYAKLRYRLIPYIYTSHWQAYTTGVPYMRAMPLLFQNAATPSNVRPVRPGGRRFTQRLGVRCAPAYRLGSHRKRLVLHRRPAREQRSGEGHGRVARRSSSRRG